MVENLKDWYGAICAVFVLLMGLFCKWKSVINAVVWLCKLVKDKVFKKQHGASIVVASKRSLAVGSITNTGSGNLTLNFLTEEKCTKNRMPSPNAKDQGAYCVSPSFIRPDADWEKLKKKFKPFERVWFFRRIDRVFKGTMRTVENLCVTCPKEQLPICVVDDRDAVKYRNGLQTLGYQNVGIYEKCPPFDELRPYAIVFFDMKGVGNDAGKDGYSLAQEFKRAYPYKKVVVRSGYLTQEQIEEKGLLDFVLEKDRDLCTQVASVLMKLSPIAGDPVSLWKVIRQKKLEQMSTVEMALIEHKYVCAISLIAQGGNVLPGDWMLGVNRLIDQDVI